MEEDQGMRIRFLFYKHERVVSSDCMKLGELLDLIARGYPGSQILGIEAIETTPNEKYWRQTSRPESSGYDQPTYCDPISVN